MHREALEELERSSVDYYAALRSVYWMDRQGVLKATLEETEGTESAETGDAPSP
jgi:hypothetical protein